MQFIYKLIFLTTLYVIAISNSFSQIIDVQFIDLSPIKDTLIIGKDIFELKVEEVISEKRKNDDFFVPNYSKEEYDYEKLYYKNYFTIRNRKSNKVGLLKNDTLILDLIYDKISVIRGAGLLKVVSEKREGIFDINFKYWYLPISFPEIKDYIYGCFIVNNGTNRYGVVDQSLNELLPFEWKNIDITLGHALICTSFSDSMYLYNIKDKKLYSESSYKYLRYNLGCVAFEAHDFNGDIKFITYKNENKYDITFKTLKAINWYYGYYAFSNNDGFGVINSGGVIIIPPIYKNIIDLNIKKHLFLIQDKNGKFAVYDINAKSQTLFQYDNYEVLTESRNGHCLIMKDSNRKDLYILNNQNEKIIIENCTLAILDDSVLTIEQNYKIATYDFNFNRLSDFKDK